MNPGELLRRHGLRPKKEWGQNFLGDERILSALTALVRLRREDTVVELGRGWATSPARSPPRART